MRRIHGLLALVLVLSVVVLPDASAQRASAVDTYSAMPVSLAIPKPTNVCAQSQVSAVGLTWDEPSGASIDGHVVQYQVVGAADWTDGPAVTDPASVVIPGLAGSRYRYRVAATSAGSRSDWGSNCLVGWGGRPELNLPVQVGASPIEFETIVSIATGDQHVCFLTSTGKVACAGDNSSNQLGDGTTTSSSVAVLVNGGALAGKTVVSISAGSRHTCAVTSAGELVCWGQSTWGQLGISPLSSPSVPVLVNGGALTGKTVLSVSAGGAHTCAVTAPGALACWGWNDNGRLGTGDLTHRQVPVAVDGGALAGATVAAVEAGFQTTCALTTSGQVMCWGANESGEVGNGGSGDVLLPTLIDGGALAGVTVAELAMATQTTCARSSSGAVACWGANTFGQLGTGNLTPASVPTAVSTGVLSTATAVSLSTAGGHVCVVTNTASVACWGNNVYGQVGDSTTTDRSVPTLADGGVLAAATASRVYVGGSYSCAVLSTGRAACWGWNSSGQLANATTVDIHVPEIVGRRALAGVEVVDVTAGLQHWCALDADGAVYCWGDNSNGQVGIAGAVSVTSPTKVASGALAGKQVVQISAGERHTCALTDLAETICWGSNLYGQLGTGTPLTEGVLPALVAPGDLSGQTVTKISAGYGHTCAVTLSGALACWGLGAWGQLGTGTTDSAATPVAVTGGALNGATVVDVDAGQSHTCARTEAALVCWGGNDAEQVSGQAAKPQLLPFAVTGGAVTADPAVSVDAAGLSSCALLTSGVAACWGGNGYGQLGTNSFASSLSPSPVRSGALATESVEALASKYWHSCASTTTGRTACWGNNSWGQLGLGTTTDMSVPSLVRDGALAGGGLSKIALGQFSTVGIWNGIAEPSLPPGAPTAVTAGNAGRTITVTWKAPAAAGAAPITGYTVEGTVDDGVSWVSLASVGSVLKSVFTVPSDNYWKFRVTALSAAGSSAPSSVSAEVLVNTLARTTRANVPVSFSTPTGDPMARASVTWKTLDGVLQSATPVLLNDLGAATLPIVATGPVVFTVTGGRVGTSKILGTSMTVKAVVQRTGTSVNLRTAALPTVVTKTITVEMPDGTRVPDVALQVNGGVGFLVGPWSYEGGTSQLSSGPSGTVSVSGFDVPTVGSDVVATFNDGFIVQTASAPLVEASSTVIFEQMPVVQMITPEPSPLDPGASSQVTVQAVDGTGVPIEGASLTLSTTAAPRSAVRTAQAPRVEALSSCAPRLVGLTGPDGRVTFNVCPTATSTWRADGSSIVASQPLRIRVKPAPAQLAAGGNHSCARVSDSTVQCWGLNSSGQLGNNSLVSSTLPVPVTGLTSVSSVAAGGAFSCAVTTAGLNGKVKCWGQNNSGQLGDGTLSGRRVPVQVTTSGAVPLTGVNAVAAGSNFACAVLSAGASGTVRCWGGNQYGQLGIGTVTGQSRPVVAVKATATAPLRGVAQISAGNAFACARMATGAVRCWGLNNYGQLGNNSFASSRYPVPVAGIDGVRAKATFVAVGDGFACARLSDGTVRCWGRNDSGQLGNGGSASSSTPVKVMVATSSALSGVSTLAVGGAHACVTTGVATSARVRCWGRNDSGQIGDRTLTNRRYPVLLPSTALSGAKQLALGGSHTVALVPSVVRPPAAAIAWGRNASGQLGDGTNSNRSSPTAIAKL